MEFARGGAETWVPVILGVAAIVYSACTVYEWGVFPLLAMPFHLMLDAASGVLLAASPWLFGFSGVVWAPHLIVGLFEVFMAATTQLVPRRSSMRPDMVSPPRSFR